MERVVVVVVRAAVALFSSLLFSVGVIPLAHCFPTHARLSGGFFLSNTSPVAPQSKRNEMYAMNTAKIAGRNKVKDESLQECLLLFE